MMDIKILGSGCPNCIKLEGLCRQVVAEQSIEATIEKVTNFDDFGQYGIMMTPGLVVNGKVLSQGKIPVKSTLENWLAKEAKP
ncbi:MAG: thioredoxin family protein [Bacteroidales bacterium]|nr:thioredoxin family protein [Bacteroidales bacterium]